GRNGSGKTSLLKILSGEQSADGGQVSRRRGLRIGNLPQEFELDGTRTVRENIEEGAADLVEWVRRYEQGEGSEVALADLQHQIDAADGWNLEARIKAEATALGVPDLDSRVAPLSGGEKRRVALCRALIGQPDLLLLDEPTNHLDSETIRWLEEFLRSFPGAVIFVTHDRYFLDVIATRIIELADGRCFSHPGNYTAYLESKAIRQQIAEQSERRRQRFLRVELEWVRAGVRAQRSKARHRIDTFYDTAGLEAPPEEREMDLLIPPAPPIGNIGIELVEAGAKVLEDGVERWLFRGLNFSLKPGQCAGVTGHNGAGKTTLLRVCMGERPVDEGEVTIGKKVGFNYIDQTRMQLDGSRTVLEEISDGSETVAFGEQRLSARGYLRRFLFADDRVRERVDRLSGGERARLMLAKVLKRGGNVIVLDEPTNDLDLPSLRMLEEALVDFGGSVLVVSHDRYFLDRVCDQIVAFEEDGVVVQTGGFSYYLEKKRERDERKRAATTPAPLTAGGQDRPRNAARPRKLTFKEQREMEGMEGRIVEMEKRVQELQKTLNDPDFYVTRAKEAPVVVAELEEARAGVARLYARWEELDRAGRGAS
ncbi:MAG TPA: ATP-binding cassette domain-containing protein, partial [Methylomirabilota bacterium]|nr:ATP-binding cassette domain-containing protein [Methylomirabilota bacterium]